MTADPTPEDARGDNGLTQAARTLLTALQWIMLGDEATPDPEAMAEIYNTLDVFRREGVEKERQRCITIAGAHTGQSNPPARYTAVQIETRIRSGDPA